MLAMQVRLAILKSYSLTICVGNGLFHAFDLNNPDANNGEVINFAAGDAVGEGINLKAIEFGNGENTLPNDVLFWVRGVGERETHGIYGRIDAFNC